MTNRMGIARGVEANSNSWSGSLVNDTKLTSEKLISKSSETQSKKANLTSEKSGLKFPKKIVKIRKKRKREPAWLVNVSFPVNVTVNSTA